MRVKASNHKDLLAELDIALVSALYRAAGEPDALDNLVATLESRYNSRSPVGGEGLRDAVVRELDTIETIVDGQSNSLSRDPLERAVEEVPTAAIVIDPFGKVILTNEYGAELFGARPGQTFDFDMIDPAYRTQFRDFTASARLRGNGRRIILRLDSLGDAEDDDAPGPLQLAEAIIVETTNRDHGCIALRMLDIPWTATVDLQLQEAFGLTRAECEISRQFYELRDTGAVAGHRGTTLATVQTQLKSVFGKTQSASQAQLLQILSLLCARAAIDSKSRLASWSNPIGREATFTRSDGREIAYSWQGAQDGKPVLFIHGHTLGHIFPPEAERLFRDAGLKVLIPSRPGFGHSEYDPELSTADDSAFAITEFCEHLGLKQVPAITASSGLVSLSLAVEQRPDLISSLTSLGYIWFAHLPLEPSMRHYQRMVFRVSHRAPRLFKAFSRIAYRNMQSVGVDWYIDKLMGEDGVDRAFFRSGKNAGLIRAASHHLLVQGPEVYTRELTISRDPILRWLEQGQCRSLFLVPDQDRVHPFEDFKRGLSFGNAAQFAELPDCGEMYFYKRSEDIARRVIQHIEASCPGYISKSVPAHAAAD